MHCLFLGSRSYTIRIDEKKYSKTIKWDCRAFRPRCQMRDKFKIRVPYINYSKEIKQLF